MRQLVVATVVALGMSTAAADAQEANLNVAESRRQLQLLVAFPSETVLTHEESDRVTGPQRLRLGEVVVGNTNMWGAAAGQPAPASRSGNRFGGPLLWALVIVAATTVGFIMLGESLSPESTFVPPDPQAAAAAASSQAVRPPQASVFTLGW